jgi:hypothetical protein
MDNGYCLKCHDFKEPEDSCDDFHCFRVDDVAEEDRQYRRKRKMSIVNIRLFQDGDTWYALLGDNMKDGLFGSGDSASHALKNLASRGPGKPWG